MPEESRYFVVQELNRNLWGWTKNKKLAKMAKMQKCKNKNGKNAKMMAKMQKNMIFLLKITFLVLFHQIQYCTLFKNALQMEKCLPTC